ncbi:MAG: L-glutamate gamma-semialdehyde dehydrogenase [Planctomycetota bacterium]|jgi:RHH-type proline utilization regulon transcriptional repressor/proline dehydrogenase/delta 1-pyrroline-5-carboxylate dehydrogenase
MAHNDRIETRIKAIGTELNIASKGAQPSLFDKGYWNGKILDYCMAHEAFKVEMFRFVDVLPMLKDPDHVARHVKEYFARDGLDFPKAVRAAMTAATAFGGLGAKMAAGTIEKNVIAMARRFVVGETPTEALPVLQQLRQDNITFTVDLLGEVTCSEVEAEEYWKRYLEVFDILDRAKADWPDNDQLDEGPEGKLPKVNVSVKVSALYSQMDPVAWENTIEALKARLRPLMKRARETGAFVNLDLEQFDFHDLTFELFMQLCDEPEFADYPYWGVVIQAYLKNSAETTRRLIRWAKRRPVPLTVRLVKGAYWDYETVIARQREWTCPVYSNKEHTDANYERISRMLIDAYPKIYPAFGSHNLRSISHAIAYNREKGNPDKAIELQSLIGMAEPVRMATVRNGFRHRVYAPVGELIPGMAYLVRRLLENTSNEGFMRQSFVEGASLDQLLKRPEEAPNEPARKRRVADLDKEPPPFRNEPPFDWSLSESREKMRAALAGVKKRFGRELPVVVNGEERKTGVILDSLNPSNTSEIVARQHQARVEDAEDAVNAARKFFPTWRDTPPRERGRVLLRAAAIMRERRHELNALLVYEAAKPWREADADVCEAIDFMEYYAREAVRVATPKKLQTHILGEENVSFYEPLGVAIIIAPWNFPMAILTGMTTAALAAGNCVLVKPSRQTSAIGWELFKILREAKAPPGSVHFMPGPGYKVGQFLIDHKETDLIAFTGSMEVGLNLLKSAAVVHEGQRNVKSVICEMGGKNAIIVDDDADLDEATRGVVYSAFGYAGQKCSACSRVIVLDKCYDDFVARLVEAVRSVKCGDSEEPGTYVPAVIDASAKKSIEEYIEIGKQEAKLLLQCETLKGGTYVGPTIFGDVDAKARIAQEEIFGPVLSVIRARDFDHAVQIALDSRYGLTGGLFSRSPANIERVRREFRVGNLYVNRTCTGAIVERHPFGGMRMSGVGSKAGGPDYLIRFMESRSVSENMMRHGFTPDVS